MTELILKGRLDGKQRNRLKGLFDLLYTPRELAQEVGFHLDQVYAVYIPLGCPNQRDGKNHILINGKDFAAWYGKVYAKLQLKQDETFCKTCKKGVKIINPETKDKNGLVYLVSACPVCGRRIAKIVERKRRGNAY